MKRFVCLVGLMLANIALAAGPAFWGAPVPTFDQNYIHSRNGVTNFFAGVGAGNQTLTSTNTTCLGNLACDALTSGISNTLIGRNAGGALTSQSRNTYVGNDAAILSLGSDNVAIGNLAMSGSTGGVFETVAIGSSALTGLNGGNNTAIGFQSGLVATSGGNVFVGWRAGDGVSSGGSNVVIGRDSDVRTGANASTTIVGDTARGATDGVAIGAAANTGTGARNTMLGRSAGGNGLMTSTDNTAVGYRALLQATSTISTTAIGQDAGFSVTSGGYNSLFGAAAGSAFGVPVGAAAITTGTNNTLFGVAANVSSSTASTRIAIGSEALSTADNQAAIGNSLLTSFVFGSDRLSSGVSTAKTVRGADAFGTDQAAGLLTIQGSRSTGTGAGGSIAFNAAPTAAGTSSALNAPATIMTINAGTVAGGGGSVSIAGTGGAGGNVPNRCTRQVSPTCTAALTCSESCEAGERVTGGGCTGTGIALHDSFPSGDGTWTCNYAVATNITAYALCCSY